MAADVAVCRWQTVEDGPPRDRIHYELKHEAHITEHALVIVPVRHPKSHHVMRTHVVIRASQETKEITLALELYDEKEDGA